MSNMVTSIILEIVDRVTGPARRIKQSLSGIARQVGLDRLTASARRAGTAISSAVENGKRLGERLLWMGGIAAGAVWGVERLVSGVTNLGMEVQNSARRLSVGTTWLQEWQYVGKQFGVQNDALVDGLKELSMRADEFVMTAGGPAAEAFKRLGIGIEELRKTEGRTESLFDLVREKIGQVQNDAARQRIMDELFGGQAAEQMVEMLGATREEIERMMRAAHDRGSILSPEELENSREYTRQMGDLQAVLFSIQATVVGNLLPAINEWIGDMGALGRANREAISRDIVDGIRDIWGGMRNVGAAVAWAADRVGGYGNLISIVAGIMAGKFLLSIVQSTWALLTFGKDLVLFAARMVPTAISGIVGLAGSLMRFARVAVVVSIMSARMGTGLIGLATRAVPAAIAGIRALSIALLTTPIGWIITGITALAGAAYLIYRNWDGVAGWFGEMWAGIGRFFDRGIGEIAGDLLAFSPAGLLMKGIDAVFELFGARPLSEIGAQWIAGLWTGIEQKWTELTGWLSAKVNALSDWMPDWARDQMGLSGMAAPRPTGPAVAGDRAAVPAPMRVETGGELRIVIDQEGRPRMAETRRRGAMDFSVESGMLGVAP
ncbi:hypothetical protein [Thalassospira sp.]|uniref:hypothetical protein n=1 Tax=Thalassospira sp. TaxID=1912094 RepID=UPI0025D0ADEB|nr:hypothetical protein [Thalassospira sp.]